MTDIGIAKNADGTGWDLDIVDGDLVIVSDSVAVVSQRIVYRLMTWLGESPYQPQAGVPYLDLVFGFQPLPGVVALLTQIVRDTKGVQDVQDLDFTLSDERTLTIQGTVTIANQTVVLDLQVSA